ncbi:MAG: ribonuclease H-like domain-containing protein [Saprospiraceae bacterium]|nr:ribonuclease H-like domain-containing protein [Saprospiraceae bacterium]
MKESRKILFLDIETVSAAMEWKELDSKWQELWAAKSKFYAQQHPELSEEQIYTDRAAIFSEFGRIVCISLGTFHQDGIRLKSLVGEEKDILLQFFDMVNLHFNDPQKHGFCGHNIREFDLPYICRRAIILNIPIPPILQLSGKKPWESHYILDTLEMWKFGDIKNFSSLDLLAACLGLPSSKTDISGKDVSRVFWQEKDIQRIAEYCMKDVALTANVYLRLLGLEPIAEDKVETLAV